MEPVRPATSYRWTSAARTDIGRVRERNEDTCVDLPDRGIWAVADGMGGHVMGDFASQAVVQTLSALPVLESLDMTVDNTRNALRAVNQLLVEEAQRMKVHTIGSTVVLLLAREHRCACLWAGDSRLYLFRDSQLTQLTRDHSLVERLKANGMITAEEAKHHPARNAITRAVGAGASLDLERVSLDANDGDVFLLCSDGLTNELEDEDIASVLAAAAAPAQATDELVNRALAHGGHDNVAVVVIRGEEEKEKARR